MKRRVSVRRLRWRESYNRVLLSVVLVALGGFGVWRAVDPPRAVVVERPVGRLADPTSAALAERFTDAFLGYDAAAPQPREDTLRAITGDGPVGAASMSVPADGRRRVRGTRIVQDLETSLGRRYVVEADTDTDGPMYLAVTVRRTEDGPRIVGYPAIVGAPSSGEAVDLADRGDEAPDEVRAISERALRNFLAGDGGNLRADLAPSARVSLPSVALRLDRVLSVRWSERGRAVMATVVASDRHGASLTLGYELGVEQRGRWFVAGIHNDPAAG
ncbi:hypothetical protein GKE82_26150 [Conexibacter sp. W3-3-2]|uniref:conjugal transfer protein n=1 Tax=Conexibacter sp. W3-3-2 TaxID=2675227 RepID=UPI0012B96FAF|nr:conjugal transfer protein [Conexibacter sp. W3-3-2]MTD47688.1 hypothetical protein [Conexibacter sp. W3-3-2]